MDCRSHIPTLFGVFFLIVILLTAVSPAQQVQQIYTEWQNPLPTGNRLNGITFVNAIYGTAVGDAGTIVTTTDGGGRWTVQESGIEAALRAVSLADRLTGFAAGDGCILALAGNSWLRSVDDKNLHLADITCTDRLHAWACGDSTILRTVNGGFSWRQTVPDTARELRSIRFNTDSSGWAVGLRSIYRTIDSGRTWQNMTAVESFSQIRFWKIQFADNNTGWLAGTKILPWPGPNSISLAGIIWKTTDGGNHWNVVYRDTAIFGFYYPHDYFYDIVFSDPLHGMFDSEVGAFATTDGGLHWQPMRSSEGDRYAMPAPDVLFAAGPRGYLARGKADSTRWDILRKGTDKRVNRVQMFTAYTGVAATAEQLTGADFLRTTDGGNSWLPATDHFRRGKFDITGIAFLDSLNGWISTYQMYTTSQSLYNSGQVFHTTDGGFTWEQQIDDSSHPRLFDIAFANSRHGIAAGSGNILLTTDGGANWHDQFIPSLRDVEFNCVTMTDSLTAWAGAYHWLYSTTNGGTTWKVDTFATVDPALNIIDIGFSTPLVGWVVLKHWSDDSRVAQVLKTTDGGRHWNTIYSSSTVTANRIFLEGDRFAALSCSDGIFVITTDGGQTWLHKAVTHFRGNLYDGSYRQGYPTWVVGSRGAILRMEAILIDEVVDDENVLPDQFRLDQNYPNPFNPQTTISYALPEESFVTLTVYNLLGQKIATLADEKQQAGTHTLDWNAAIQPSGLYFYKLSAGKYSQVRKMLLVR